MSKPKRVLLPILCAIASIFLFSGAAGFAARAADDYAGVGAQYFHTDTPDTQTESFLNKAPLVVPSYRGVRTEITSSNSDANAVFNGNVNPVGEQNRVIITFDYNTKGSPVADAVVLTYTALSDPTKQISLVNVNRGGGNWITVSLTDDLYFSGGFMYVNGTSQPVIGLRDNGTYDQNGYTVWNGGNYGWGALYGEEYQVILPTEDYSDPTGFTLKKGDVKINNWTNIANIFDDNWLTASKANLGESEYAERYTAEYAQEVLDALAEGSVMSVQYYGLKDGFAAFNIRQINGQWIGDGGNVAIDLAKTKAYSVQKTDTLYKGVPFKASDIFDLYSVNDTAEKRNSWASGFIGASEWIVDGSAADRYFEFGNTSNPANDKTFTVNETGEYHIIVSSCNSNPASAATGWSTQTVFTFTVKDGKPTVELAEGANFVKDVEVDLSEFFDIWNLGDDLSVTYAADGEPLPGSAFTPTGESHEITVTASDLYGTTTETFTIPCVEISVPETAAVSGYYGKPVSLPLPVVPEGTQYTLCVYDEENNEITTSVSHVFAEGGTYTVVYTFTVSGSSAPITKECAFTLTLETLPPEIVINGEYEDSYFVGKRLTVLGAEASDGTETYPVNTEVYLNGSKVEVTDGTIALSEGEYEIVYSVSYGDGLSTEVRRGFTVLADTEAPVIVVDGSYGQTYQTGNVLGILDAKVTDNSGEPLDYTVQITRGRDVITAENGELRLEKGGSYKIVYRAADLAGNSAEKVFEFTVSGSGCACSGEVGGEIWFAALLLPAAAVWIIMRRKKSENEK